MENYVPIVVFGLSTGSSSSAAPTSPTSVLQEAEHTASTRSESTSSIERIRRDPSREPEENQYLIFRKWQRDRTERPVARMVRRNLRRSLWMKVFQNTGIHPRVLLVNQLQSREEKWYRASTVFTLTSRRTEIATSAWGPKQEGLFAENALVQPYFKQKMLVIQSQQITKFLVKDVNLETNIGLLSWYKTWQLSGSNLYPCKNKNLSDNGEELTKVLRGDEEPKVMYTDNSVEFGRSCEELSWNPPTPHSSEINGIAERAVRRIKEGTSAGLLQSGLDEKLVGRFHGMLHLSAKRSRSLFWWEDPIWETFWEPFKGPIIPFGSLVEYYPTSARDQSRIHQFGKKVLPGLFLGYALYAVRIWKGDVLVADLEELETMDASAIYSKKTQCKGSNISQKNEKFIFPAADGRSNLLGWDQELRTSTLIREHPIWKMVGGFHRVQMRLQKEQCAEWNKGHLRYCCNQVWMKNGRRISQSVPAICGTYKISCLMRRVVIRRPIWWTSNSIWFDGRISPYFCQRPVATASVRQESLIRYILWLCATRGENLERRHIGRRHWGIWKRWTHQTSVLGDAKKRKC